MLTMRNMNHDNFIFRNYGCGTCTAFGMLLICYDINKSFREPFLPS